MNIDFKKFLFIKGAKTHNLKNITLKIPKKKLVVFTGLSGSGKSSLAFDTIYAEGQNRYVECLSSYARQFLNNIEKPDVEQIKGISPSIAIEQKKGSNNPRSTVGTISEVYDYLKLLYARIGKTYSPISGNLVKYDTVEDVVQYLFNKFINKIIIISTSIKIPENRTFKEQLSILIQQGFSRIIINNKIEKIEDIFKKNIQLTNNIILIIDRVKISIEEKDRIYDSIEIAYNEGNARCIIYEEKNSYLQFLKTFSYAFEEDNIKFEIPTVHLFSFNNSYGYCPTCKGYGTTIGIDENLVIPNPSLSVYNGAIACWNGNKMDKWRQNLILNAYKVNFPIHKAYSQLNEKEKDMLWNGTKYFKGINDFFKYLEENFYKIQYRVLFSRYVGKTICYDCKGGRLRKEANYVKINGKSISELCSMQVNQLINFFENIKLEEYEKKIAEKLLVEIKARLYFINDVGLSYLTLNRNANTLSGGEMQRLQLSRSLSSSLVGSIYVLDEPTIGLHPKDTERLIKAIKKLRDIGNTLIVVEHDENVIKAADEIVDLGPAAGINGGNIVFQGSYDDLLKCETSITSQYLTGKKKIEVPAYRRKSNNYIEIFDAYENNLKHVNVKIPLNSFVVVTGVSGSGKSSLVIDVLYNTLCRKLKNSFAKSSKVGDVNYPINLKNVELVDQNPIGKSSRSNPISYIKGFEDIRKLFAEQKLARQRRFSPSFFSFNVEGGRCENCKGEGIINVDMQFMPDVKIICEECGGKRFTEEILEIKYNNKNIYEILEMTVDEAIIFFEKDKDKLNNLMEKLYILKKVGLGYIKLGQASSTLSGGESQRIKLASFLANGSKLEHTLFIFDEPTTGLHFDDVKKLLKSFNELIKRNNSIIVIEHNLDIIKSADWIIDIGPDAGENGGEIIFEGTPEELVNCNKSFTAKYLKYKI